MADRNFDLEDDGYEFLLDHSEVDKLTEEEFKRYEADPKAFAEGRETSSKSAAGTDTPASPDPTNGDPPERPAEQTPATPGTDTAASGDEDIHIENPWKEQGIPDIWLIDSNTGEAYENGLILGKYTTADKAFDAVPHMMKVIGKRDRAPEPDGDDFEPSAFIAPTVDDATRTQVTNYAYGRAMDEYKAEFDRLGLTPEDFGDDLEGLRTASEALYYRVTERAKEHYDAGTKFVQDYIATSQQREELQQHATAAGFNIFVDKFESATGVEADESDVTQLNDAYNGVIVGILRTEEKYKRMQAANPNVNLYDMDGAAKFFDDFYEQRNGVPILSAAKVARAALNVNEGLLYAAVRQTATEKHRKAIEQDIAATPGFPTTAATKADGGATGASMPQPPWAEFSAPGYFDRLVKATGGNEDEAQKLYDRQAQAFDDEWMKQTQGRRTTHAQAQY